MLALAVVVFHSFEVSYGRWDTQVVYTSIWRPFVASLLPLFFGLSGFLVAGSLERAPNLRHFFALRVLRIMPALAVETIICALIIGPWLTTLPLATYFQAPLFASYFWNIIGDVQFHLPGLFTENPSHDVNAQLWTVPFELGCYMLLGLSILLRLRRKLDVFVILAFFYFVEIFILNPADHARASTVDGATLILTFFAGLWLYRGKKKIPYHANIFFLSVAVSLILLSFPVLDMFVALPAAYMAVYLGLCNPPRRWVITSGDYSYGIFLYGYGIQQTVAHFPPLRIWYINVLIALPVIFACAFLSWHGVEKRVLRLRRYLRKPPTDVY